MVRTFALIAQVHTVLHRVSCSYEVNPNAHKHYEMHENMSLGSKGVDWVRSLRKSRRDFVARTFALIALVHPVLHRVSCTYEMITNAPKHYETHKNMSLGSNGLDWVRSLRKIPSQLQGTKFSIIAPVQPSLHQVFCINETIQDAPKTPRSAPKPEFTVQWGGPDAFVVKNSDTTSWHKLFFTNCTSSVQIASSFVQ